MFDIKARPCVTLSYQAEGLSMDFMALQMSIEKITIIDVFGFFHLMLCFLACYWFKMDFHSFCFNIVIKFGIGKIQIL